MTKKFFASFSIVMTIIVVFTFSLGTVKAHGGRHYNYGTTSSYTGSVHGICRVSSNRCNATVTINNQRVSLNCKTLSGARGCEVQVSTSRNSGYKTMTSSTNLQRGKTYYFRARPYKIVNNQKVCGSYCTPKAVTIR